MLLDSTFMASSDDLGGSERRQEEVEKAWPEPRLGSGSLFLQLPPLNALLLRRLPLGEGWETITTAIDATLWKLRAIIRYNLLFVPRRPPFGRVSLNFLGTGVPLIMKLSRM